jgi:single-strand DNA-binding protein
MTDTFVTFHGWVGADVTFRTPAGISVANLRVAVTPRIRRSGTWVDGDTTWYSVTAWRTLAEHVRDSIRKGDAVIVHGRLRTETWQRENEPPSTTLVVDATLVGHDLSRGTSTFLKAVRQERGDTDVDSEVSQMVHDGGAGASAMTSWGEPKPDAA